MTDYDFYKLKYPIGIFNKPDNITPEQIKDWINSIEAFPDVIDSFTNNLSEEELNSRYRPKGWTIKAVVHHCANSHMNSIIRFKIALTEDTPTIKPYYEARFAKLVDYVNPIEASILILKGVHTKLEVLLKSLSDKDLKREFIHPEHDKYFSLEETIGVYAWHCNHHLAHIKQALRFKGKFQ